MTSVAAIAAQKNSNSFLRRFAKSKTGIIGSLVFLAIILMAISASWVYPNSPWRMVSMPLLWPGEESQFLFGTDALGRDIMAGVFHGSRVSLTIALISTAVSVLFGTSIGAVAGYAGGRVDDALMRLTEIFQTIPPFLLAIVVVAIFKPTQASITLAIAIVSWPSLAKLVRAEALRLKSLDFVQSCIIIGMSPIRIIATQIVPNCMAPIIVTASLMVANAILIESGLAFLNLGDPNNISWGAIIGSGRSELRSAWYICIIPGVVVAVAVLSLNLIGDGLNDAFNRRMHRS